MVCSSHLSHQTMGGSVIATGAKGDMRDFSTHLIVSPTQHDIGQSAVGLVDTVLGRVHRVLQVWVVLERVRINILFRKLASDDECISNDVPLALGAEKEQKFSQIVDETGYLHPFRLSVASNSLGGL